MRAEALQLSLISAPFWDRRSAVTQLSFSRQTSHPSPSFSHFISKISTFAYLVHLHCHYLHLNHRWLISQERKKIPKWREAPLPSLTALQLPHGSPYSGAYGAPCHPYLPTRWPLSRQSSWWGPLHIADGTVSTPPHYWEGKWILSLPLYDLLQMFHCPQVGACTSVLPQTISPALYLWQPLMNPTGTSRSG